MKAVKCRQPSPLALSEVVATNTPTLFVPSLSPHHPPTQHPTRRGEPQGPTPTSSHSCVVYERLESSPRAEHQAP